VGAGVLEPEQKLPKIWQTAVSGPMTAWHQSTLKFGFRGSNSNTAHRKDAWILRVFYSFLVWKQEKEMMS
jgi:hypothetical protein